MCDIFILVTVFIVVRQRKHNKACLSLSEVGPFSLRRKNMNPRYFKDKVCEELEDSAHYLKKAIDCFKMHPEWSNTFREMADGEQEHATDLYKMFMEMYTTSDKREQLESARDTIMDCFSKHMRIIEDCKATLDMMMYEDQNTKWIPPHEEKTVAVSNIMKGISE